MKREVFFPEAPPNAPKAGGPIRKWFARKVILAMGWRVVGELPNETKIIFSGGPHTTNWDFVLVLLVRWALGVNFSYLMKKEAFFWPMKNFFISMGGFPVDRSKTTGVLMQVDRWFGENEKAWLAITPEGTRSKVKKWKTGILRMSKKTEVPIFIIGWDYPSKTFALDGIWPTGDNQEEEIERLRLYVTNKFTGKFKNRQ